MLLILALVVVIFILVLVCIFWIVCRKSQRVRAFLQKVWRMIFWNTIIRTIFESSIGLLLGAMIKTESLSTKNGFEIFSSILTIG